MDNKEYILYCDESEKSGRFYSNFYAGVMIGSSQHARIISVLENEKKRLNLLGEVKWSKVTERYLEKYQALIKIFFSEVKARNLKIRIMFRNNIYEADTLTNHKHTFFKLYYQFIKHAYGLQYANLTSLTKLRIFFDAFPENREAASRFKKFLLELNENPKIQKSRLFLQEEDITEINSHHHVLLQCLDIVLGAIQFRLNEKQGGRTLESMTRAKRTVAKEILYQTILGEIKTIRKEFESFNIGESTFVGNTFLERWTEPYLHWSFVPRHYIFKEVAKDKKQPQPTYRISDA